MSLGPRMRGAIAGGATLALLGAAAALVAGGALLGVHGELVAGSEHEAMRFALVLAAAAAAGVVSSVAAGTYASGTSVLAGAGGLIAIWIAGRLGHGSLAPEPDDPVALRDGLEAGALLLATYVAAWQTDVRWTLPPDAPRKTVPRREVLRGNLPALLVCAAVALAGSRAASALLDPGWRFAGWALACGVGARVAQTLFHPRSTFFLWTAPLAALLAGAAATGAVWPGVDGVPAGLVVPLASFTVAVGSLLPRGEDTLWPVRLTRSATSP